LDYLVNLNLNPLLVHLSFVYLLALARKEFYIDRISQAFCSDKVTTTIRVL